MNNTNKTKLTAMVRIITIILSLIALTGCVLFIEDSIVLDKEIPNLDNQSISYLLIRNLDSSENVTDIDYYYCSINGGFSIKDGILQYDPAIIEVSSAFDGEGLDKNAFSLYLVKESAISIWGNFYPVKGDIGDLEYEFKYVDSSPYKYHRAVYIYSNSQLVGKVYYDASKTVQKEWITDFLNDNLILMNIKQYSAEKSNNVENSQNHIVSYLNIGNIVTSEYCREVKNYSSDVNGGLTIEFGSKYHNVIKNTVNIDLEGDVSINYADISIHAEFYEIKEALDVLKYEIVDNLKDNSSTVNIYNEDIMVGKISINYNKVISHEWIENFLNENLIVNEVKNR